MKLSNGFLGVVFCLGTSLFSQVPGKMSYQAVVRDNSNKLVTNQEIGMRISILQGSVNGSSVYAETQKPETNDNGLVSVEIGGSPGFSGINWSNGPYFIKTEIDLSGGANYTISGTSQLLTVPFAFHANIADSISGGFNESDPGFTSSPASGISNTDIASWNNKLDVYNETDPAYNASVASGITVADTAAWNAASNTGFSETDPVFAAWDKSSGISISESQVINLKSYLTDEADPLFNASIAYGITSTDTAAWNAATGYSYTETDPVFTTWDRTSGVSITESQISDLQNYVTNEADPVFSSSIASSITGADTAAWNAASVGSYSETDPVYTAWDKSTGISITESQISDLQSYVTSENDPVYVVSVAAAISSADTARWGNKLDTEVDGSTTNEIQDLNNVLTQNNDAGALQIKNLADPTEDQDAVTKAYVDAIISKLSSKGVLTADVDGNFYLTVIVGDQLWMGENLRTTRYADGSAIPVVADSATWVALGDNSTDDARCFYNNDVNNESGVLYTWAAAMNGASGSTSDPSGVQGVCPDGWHLPSQAEWASFITLIGANGFPGDEGNVLKSTSGWNSGGNGTNNYGFNAYPIGRRDGDDGAYSGDGDQTIFWTATENDATSAIAKTLDYDQTTCLQTTGAKSSGFSVRCVKD